MKQTLQLRMSQHLALTPQLQQSIRLLQLSTLELHQELEQILSDNPLLERMDDPLDHSVRLLADGAISPGPAVNGSAEAPQLASDGGAEEPNGAADGGDVPDAPAGAEGDWSFDDVARTSKAPDDDDARPQLEAPGITLREHLLDQMRLTVRESRDRALVELIIDALNDNGYLDEPLEEIHARLPEELGIDLDELRVALTLVQSFEPAGIGARNASECLALQIRRLPKIPLITRRMALNIVENHLTLFAQRDFNKLRKL
ncbi:MAG TPA: RNA polymerase factor sigma-54, partial [Noviherbaspirillum sp.]|nr:RNA polymerase factor sigma-54 [Noviherbaspirillum sp.]